MTNEMLSAKMELKELVDRFSDYSDLRDAKSLSELFTSDGVLEFQTGYDGELQNLSGRETLYQAFSATLAPSKALYHINGQHIVKLNGDDEAEGISYCQASFVSDEGGKNYLTTNYIRYTDNYVKENGKWYIKRRRSTFVITDKHEMN